VDLAKSVDWTVVTGLDKFGGPCRASSAGSGSPGGDHGARLGIIGDTPALIDATGVGDPIVETLQERPRCKGYKFTQVSKQQLMEGLALAIQSPRYLSPTGRFALSWTCSSTSHPHRRALHGPSRLPR
jgi:hypothetical protein